MDRSHLRKPAKDIANQSHFWNLLGSRKRERYEANRHIDEARMRNVQTLKQNGVKILWMPYAPANNEDDIKSFLAKF